MAAEGSRKFWKPGALADRLTAMSAELSSMERSTRLGQEIRDTRAHWLNEMFDKTRRGEQISRGLSTLTGEGIHGLFEAGAVLYPEEAQHLAVLAVGGFGRGRLAPFSDIDLLFLHSANAGQKIKPLLDFILYTLWDAGLNVAQAVRSPAQSIDFVKTDIEGCTSYLDGRYLVGNEALARDFFQRFDRYRKGTVSPFIEAKLKEREERISKGTGSRYAVEPDIKEGKGGLRDLETLHWLARYAYGATNVEQRVNIGVFTDEEAASYEKALDFLWSVRVQLHRLRERPDEQLTFDIQPKVADALNYNDRGQTLGVERLMKHYFINAKEVGRLTGVVCAALEEAEVKRSRLIESFFRGLGGGSRKQDLNRRIRPDEVGTPTNITLRGDRVDFRDHAKAQETPLDLFRLFRIAARKPAAEIHPEALKTVAAGARFMKRASVEDEDVATIFRAIILDTENPEEALRDMTECGLLGSYLPAFGMLIGRVKYGLYRGFTLDEHVLRSVGVLDHIRHGDESDHHPIATRIMAKTHDPLSFYLAILMHESGETLTNPTPDRLRRKIVSSIGHLVPDKDRLEDIVWAATRYQMMANIAVRRNVMEERTIETFAAEVETGERLDLLMVLTICHLRMAGFNSWDRWTRRDLGNLYEATKAWFSGGAEALAAHILKQRDVLRSRAARLLSDWPVQQLDRYLLRLPAEFFEGVDPATAVRFVKLMRQVDGGASPGSVELSVHEDGLVEAAIYSRDKPGLYAAIAGVVIANGGMVRASTAFPVKPAGKGVDMAGNIVVFHGEHGRSILEGQDEEAALAKLQQQFEEAITRPGYEKIKLRARVGDRRHVFDVPSQVKLDQHTSHDCLIVEAKGRDRPGLLYRLAAALSDIGVSIRSAYIANYGEMAVDTFYIQDLPGYKITDRRRQEVIRRSLLAVLDGD